MVQVPRCHPLHELAGYCSAPQENNLNRLQLAYLLCRQNPTHPAGSPQSTLPALWAASAGPVVRIAPQDDLPDLVQNAAGLLEIPLPLSPCLVRQVLLQEVEKSNSLVVQLGELCLWNTRLASGDILVSGIRDWRVAIFQSMH